ncbi:hypothetical protein C5167_046312 [Papaver somniferum]|uniref:Uncharacterized protein n=1 Tax=Papaver somniferum TaxID=3469 RepID=A0A4Y7LE68_PAPSO|nr:hypothetical protein C5167_046312 [Papaver somniferum]
MNVEKKSAAPEAFFFGIFGFCEGDLREERGLFLRIGSDFHSEIVFAAKQVAAVREISGKKGDCFGELEVIFIARSSLPQNKNGILSVVVRKVFVVVVVLLIFVDCQQ